MDYSDLFDIMSFFEGAPDGSTSGNQHLAKQIGERGKKFVQDHWREEDLQSFGLLQLMEVSVRDCTSLPLHHFFLPKQLSAKHWRGCTCFACHLGRCADLRPP